MKINCIARIGVVALFAVLGLFGENSNGNPHCHNISINGSLPSDFNWYCKMQYHANYSVYLNTSHTLYQGIKCLPLHAIVFENEEPFVIAYIPVTDD
ncbi:hypothetical protein E2C01_084948 [Portunus trituberculatus]|uniref:Uncharacterized protein n=1 Tax=Portunus trituberculatus TaxID=210409 RepID=A0A5B7J1A8_PORTR|nr:hypothetical protein [Portunus trituberculatus]